MNWIAVELMADERQRRIRTRLARHEEMPAWNPRVPSPLERMVRLIPGLRRPLTTVGLQREAPRL